MNAPWIRTFKLTALGTVLLASGFATSACQSAADAAGTSGEGSASHDDESVSESHCFSESFSGSGHKDQGMGISLTRDSTGQITGFTLARNNIEVDSIEVQSDGQKQVFFAWNDDDAVQLLAPGSPNAHIEVEYCLASKVAVCHVPPGDPTNAHTINVGGMSVKAHLAHGDSVGACGGGTAAGASGGSGSTGTTTAATGGTGTSGTTTAATGGTGTSGTTTAATGSTGTSGTTTATAPAPSTAPSPGPATGDSTYFTINGFDGVTDAGAAYLVWYTVATSSTSQVLWGLTPALGNASPLNSNLVTNHSVTVGGLVSGTTYYFQAVSTDAAGHLSYSPIISKTTL